MPRLLAIAGDTLMLCTVGALLGGACGVGAIFLAGLPGFSLDALTSFVFLSLYGALLGGALGGLLGPFLGWFVLRGVVVQRAVWTLPLGTLSGAFAALAAGWLVADVSDGKGTLYLSGGGIIGVVITSVLLRIHARQRPSKARDARRLGAMLIP